MHIHIYLKYVHQKPIKLPFVAPSCHSNIFVLHLLHFLTNPWPVKLHVDGDRQTGKSQLWGRGRAPTGLSSKTRWVCTTIQNISGPHGDNSFFLFFFFFMGISTEVSISKMWDSDVKCEGEGWASGTKECDSVSEAKPKERVCVTLGVQRWKERGIFVETCYMWACIFMLLAAFVLARAHLRSREWIWQACLLSPPE